MSTTQSTAPDEQRGEAESTTKLSDEHARVAAVVFDVYVVLALPAILFGLGAYHWFLRDDWLFLAGRDASLDDLFRRANGSHWNTIPVLVFRGIWNVFGLHSYRPYQAAAVALHLVSAVLLRQLMRRGGVRPWIATAAAGLFVLFGPGQQNIVLAFAVGLGGSLAFGLAQLLLADHDGPISRRDVMGLGAGLLALMSSGVGSTMVIAVGVAVLLRRGWRAAAFHTVPLGLVYLTWSSIEHPRLNPYGRPPIGLTLDWFRVTEWNTFRQLGHFLPVGVAFAVLLVAGYVIALRTFDLARLRQAAAAPTGLLVASVVFSVSAALGRWGLGIEAATASRYAHVGAALTLPALAFAAEAIATRWRTTVVPIVALLLLPVPWNIAAFEPTVFDAGYFAQERQVLLAAPGMPFATDVPRDVRPWVDPLMKDVTIGYLLDEREAGKLPALDRSIPAPLVNELRVRLGVAQRDERPSFERCRTIEGSFDLSPRRGSIIAIQTRVTVATYVGGRRTSSPVEFDPLNGETLEIELDGLDLRFGPAFGATTFRICS